MLQGVCWGRKPDFVREKTILSASKCEMKKTLNGAQKLPGPLAET